MVEFLAAIESGTRVFMSPLPPGLLASAPVTKSQKTFFRTLASNTFSSLPPKFVPVLLRLEGPALFQALERGAGDRQPLGPPEGAALSPRAQRSLGVWPGLGIFVMFKCQRLLLTPFPNTFLIYPVSLLREKLFKKKKKTR